MPRNLNAYRIGVFIIICGVLTIGALIWFGASSLFQNTRTYASYFNESVKGLQKDAVVNYRGVAVGHVSTIDVAPDQRLVEVLIKLKPDFHVDDQVAIQLRDQGLTGLRYLEIDTAPHSIDQLTPKLTFTPKYPVLRTYPSEISRLKTALQDLYEKVSAVDIQGLTETWTRTAAMVNNLLAQLGATAETGDVKDMISNLKKTTEASAALLDRLNKHATEEGVSKGFADLGATLTATRQASENLSRQLSSLPPEVLKQLSQQLDQTLKNGGTLFSGLSQQLGQSATLLENDLQQMQIVIARLKEMVQEIKDRPSRLVYPGKQPPDPFESKKQ